MESRDIKGAYFPYCQWCRWDGDCVLSHYQFLGMKPAEGIDRTPYPGHEDVEWHATGFQRNSHRGMCQGRIMKSGAFFYPLICQCGTAVSSLKFSFALGATPCCKFQFSEGGEKDFRRFEAYVKEWEEGIEEEVDIVDALRDFNPDYQAVMMA